VRRIDLALAPPEKPEPDIDPELAKQLARIEARKSWRAGLRPQLRRHAPLKIPESLEYYESIHGTRATLEMLADRSRRDR
jgi:hypothetical protein